MGGSSLLVVGLLSWIGRLMGERVASKWRRDEQTMIELLRNALAGDKLLFESAIRGFQVGQDAHQPKRLSAIEALWSEVLRLREEFSQPVFFCSIFVPAEYDSLLRERGDLIALIAEFNIQSIAENMRQGGLLERERPYLGETLWLQFFIYRAFLGRLAIVLSDGVRKGRLEDWRKDDGIRQIISNLLPSETVVSLLEKSPFIAAISRTVNALETLLLKEISLIVSGRRSSFESFENAKELRAAMDGVERTLGNSGAPNFK